MAELMPKSAFRIPKKKNIVEMLSFFFTSGSF